MLLGKVLDYLLDGQWHTLDAVAHKLQMSVPHTARILLLLDKGGFVQYDEQQRKVLIRPNVVGILKEILKEDEKNINDDSDPMSSYSRRT